MNLTFEDKRYVIETQVVQEYVCGFKKNSCYLTIYDSDGMFAGRIYINKELTDKEKEEKVISFLTKFKN